ncbi:MAG TPA: PHP domain-containing protein [Candidatus Ozemobacteraceae bacterium]|nr:PHP domain-containing protein [Candidatus Ozemobacteraceae bacterium]
MTVVRRRINLHNHTTFSDGRFAVSEIVAEAARVGLEGIGISDHFYTRKVFRRSEPQAWLNSVWPAYLAEAETWRAAGSGGPKVWFGIELDTCFDRVEMSLAELPWAGINSLDYLLVEYAGEEEWGGMPVARLAELRQHCRIPVIVAHPAIDRLEDSLRLGPLCDMVRRFGYGLEMPGGSRNPWFWARRDAGILRDLCLTIGTDTHERLEDVGEIGKCLAFLERNGLLDRLADPDRLAEGIR